MEMAWDSEAAMRSRHCWRVWVQVSRTDWRKREVMRGVSGIVCELLAQYTESILRSGDVPDHGAFSGRCSPMVHVKEGGDWLN